MTEQDSNTAGQPPTHRDRFEEACKTTKFTPYELSQGPYSGYLTWSVEHVLNGQEVTVDGPFFTEEEANISADLLRGTFRGARACECICDRIWNYRPSQEQDLLDQACSSRHSLARQLGVDLQASPNTNINAEKQA